MLTHIIAYKWLVWFVVICSLMTPQLSRLYVKIQSKNIMGSIGSMRNMRSMGSMRSMGNIGHNFIMGDAPAEVLLCNEVSDMMQVDKVQLIPNPPQKGQNVTVKVNGILKRNLNNGSYLLANVKRGIKLPQLKISACDYLQNGCPIEKGNVNLSMTFDIPSMMPGGTYDVHIVLFNIENESRKTLQKWKKLQPFIIEQEENRVLCLQGSINF
jgi:hypothetical protein